MRWKANFYDKKQNDQNINTGSKFGLKSNKSPKQNYNLIPFENDICDMISNIEFRKSYNSPFQRKLKNDVRGIKQSEKLFVFADKTTNLYSLSKEEYNKLLRENITKDYKHAEESVVSSINKEAKEIAGQLNGH